MATLRLEQFLSITIHNGRENQALISLPSAASNQQLN